MTPHHIVCSESTKISCLYCGNSLDKNDWKSDHVMQRHYKVNNCTTCGKEGKLEVDFAGDGTDSWAMPIEKQLQAIGKIRRRVRKAVVKETNPHKPLENIVK